MMNKVYWKERGIAAVHRGHYSMGPLQQIHYAMGPLHYGSTKGPLWAVREAASFRWDMFIMLHGIFETEMKCVCV
jgi:hypothetical protein